MALSIDELESLHNQSNPRKGLNIDELEKLHNQSNESSSIPQQLWQSFTDIPRVGNQILGGIGHGVGEIGRGALNIPSAISSIAGYAGVPGASQLGEKLFIPEQQTPGYDPNSMLSKLASGATETLLPLGGAKKGLSLAKSAIENNGGMVGKYIRGLTGKDIQLASKKADEVAKDFSQSILKSRTPQEANTRLESALKSQKNVHEELLNKHDIATEKLLNENKENVTNKAQDFIQELYGAKSPKEVAEKLGKEDELITDELFKGTKKDKEMSHELYEKFKNKEGNNLYPKMPKKFYYKDYDVLTSIPKDKRPSVFSDVGKELEKVYEDPTAINFHNFQSKLGSLIRELKAEPYATRTEYSTIKNLENLRQTYLEIIDKFGGPEHKIATNFYKEHILPLEQDPTIYKASVLGKPTPGILKRLTQEEVDPGLGQIPVRKAQEKLTEQGKNILLASKFRPSVDFNGNAIPEKISNSANNAVRQGFGDFMTNNHKKSINDINDLLQNESTIKNIRSNQRENLKSLLKSKEENTLNKANTRKSLLKSFQSSKTPEGDYAANEVFKNLNKLVKKDIEGSYENINEPLGKVKQALDELQKHEKTAKHARATIEFLKSFLPSHRIKKVVDIANLKNKRI